MLVIFVGKSFLLVWLSNKQQKECSVSKCSEKDKANVLIKIGTGRERSGHK